MNVVLKRARTIIGTWLEPISIDGTLTLPHQLRAPAYRYGHLVRWSPLGPPPSSQGERVTVPFWCGRNKDGGIEMIVDDDLESLFRTHPLFRAT